MLAGLPENFNQARALVLPGQRLVSGGDAQLRVKNVKDAVQRAGVGVILDLHGTVFDAFASVCAGHLEGQVEASHISGIAQDSGFFVLSRNWWRWATRHVPEREYFGLLGAPAN